MKEGYLAMAAFSIAEVMLLQSCSDSRFFLLVDYTVRGIQLCS
jgi:hypothetical protein